MTHDQMQRPIRMLRFEFPPVLAIDVRWRGNRVQQLLQKGYWEEVVVDSYQEHGVMGYVLTPVRSPGEPVLAITNSALPPEALPRVLRARGFSPGDEDEASLSDTTAEWERHPSMRATPEQQTDYPARIQQTINSWQNAFVYQQEDPSRQIRGLRPPQLGAVHAVHAHWAVSNAPATVVMPTGTGKTEAMLSVLITERCTKLLVIVPTDALRAQIAGKFLGLGILDDLGVLSGKVMYPIVGVLKHRPEDVDEVDELFEKCQVLVTTMNIAGQCSREVKERMAERCPYLFIDEAHHLGARTWRTFKERFSSARILQFTATPFREDGKPVEGKPIFNYPLKKAQDEGYFRPIRFEPVVEFDPKKRDLAIAKKAVEQLCASYEQGHVLMARAGSVARADEVFSVYEPYKNLHPVRIHTGLSKAERDRVRREILSGEARIVVCVDMLGEGFDLPELKIAAFHDIRKSLPVTLQLAGRFTRSRGDLGDPVFVANIADVEVKEELRKLYAQDSDWNVLLRNASMEAIQEEFDLWEFVEGFQKFPRELSLQNVRPAMSTVAYRTKCKSWTPDSFERGIRGLGDLDRVYHDLNPQENTLVILTTKKMPIDWAQIEDIYTWAWELYILYWDQEQQLLFIHGSSNSGFYKDLAVAVAGEDVEQIRGPTVFRCLSGVNRLRLQNVGLLQQLGRLIRYTMRAGSDVEPALTESQRRNTIKANIFGAGFENGGKTTIGCSYRGRIWSRRTTNIQAFTRWCSFVGCKLLDDTIDPDEVLKGTLVPVAISQRPTRMPVAIDWPEMMYREAETQFELILGTDEAVLLYQADIDLVDPSEAGALRFEVSCGEVRSQFELQLFERGDAKDFRILQISTGNSYIRYGSTEVRLSDFFYENPPTIWFADGSSLEEGNNYIGIGKTYPPYSVDKIDVWNWTGTDIRRESQGILKAPGTVQHAVIGELKKGQYDVIFDDDGSGEAADVVAIRAGDTIEIELYHCKYSSEPSPGHRIDDLYELCGQAQKCIHWMEEPSVLFSHLLRREPRMEVGQTATRFELGSKERLITLQEMSRTIRVQWKVYIVQPGLSREQVSTAQLELLSVTENHLMETYQVPFRVIASA